MSRRIHVRVSSTGEITVEAEGFQGKGCEAATKAIEDALGKPRERTRKPDFPCRGYAGVTRKAPYVIHLKGPYDIAVDPSPEKDGSYGLTTDWWDGHVAKEVGIGYGRLLQAYGVHKTIREAHSRGLRSTRRVEADGSILVTLEGGSL